jgi:iron complex outermembrane recepter protein
VRNTIRVLFITLAALSHGAVWATEPAPPGPLEEVRVTGYHVSRLNYDGPTPVDLFDQEQLKASGAATLNDFLSRLPYNTQTAHDGQALFSRQPNGQFANLRALGSGATLVLVNGHRVAASPRLGNTGYDLNTIPLQAVDRIEVVKDGASAIYGADAVAGVINVILQRDYSGAALQAGYASSIEGDGEELDLGFNFGWQGDRASLTGFVNYFDRQPQFHRDRSYTDSADLRRWHGQDQRTKESSPGTAMLLASQGMLSADPACPTQTGQPAQLKPLPNGESECRYDPASRLAAIPQAQRAGVYLSGNYEFGPELTAFADVGYSQNETNQPLPAAPIKGLVILRDHPNNPFQQPLVLGYRVLDGGDREPRFELTSSNATLGVEGIINDLNWQLSYTYSEQEDRRKVGNAIDKDNFEAALKGQGGPNADQYYNPFGMAPTNDPAVIRSFTRSLQARGNSRLDSLDMQLQGQLDYSGLPTMNIAVGGQLRKEQADSAGFQDNTDIIGFPWGNFLYPAAEGAERDIRSVYTELGMPLGPRFEIQLAARYDDYSDFGAETSPKIGIAWRLSPSWLLRGSWGTSFVPPALDQVATAERITSVPFTDTPRCDATGRRIDCDQVNRPVTQGGNTDLEAQNGESRVLSARWRPGEIEGLSMEAGWWYFELDQAIHNASSSFVLNHLYDDPAWLRRSQPSPDAPPGDPGPIEFIRNAPINAGLVQTRGVDLRADYQMDFHQRGQLLLAMTHTYTDDWRLKTGVVTDEDILDRNLVGSMLVGILPEWKSLYSAHWLLQQHELGLTIRYVDGYRSNLSRYIDGKETERPYNVSSQTTLDFQYSRKFPQWGGARLRLGCRNCTDEDPPRYNYTYSWEGIHAGRGAVVYARWEQPF